MVDENSDEYRLAEAVAELTAQRFRAGLKEEMDARDERLLELWREDMGKLRDDLTAKGLLEELRGMPIQADGEDGLSAVRVLVVDDYPEIRRAFVKIFTASGMLVREAEDGAAAVEILDNDHMIEVVVADISMPNLKKYYLKFMKSILTVIIPVGPSPLTGQAIYIFPQVIIVHLLNQRVIRLWMNVKEELTLMLNDLQGILMT